jgi:hypothetical protein
MPLIVVDPLCGAENCSYCPMRIADTESYCSPTWNHECTGFDTDLNDTESRSGDDVIRCRACRDSERAVDALREIVSFVSKMETYGLDESIELAEKVLQMGVRDEDDSD